MPGLEAASDPCPVFVLHIPPKQRDTFLETVGQDYGIVFSEGGLFLSWTAAGFEPLNPPVNDGFQAHCMHVCIV